MIGQWDLNSNAMPPWDLALSSLLIPLSHSHQNCHRPLCDKHVFSFPGVYSTKMLQLSKLNTNNELWYFDIGIIIFLSRYESVHYGSSIFSSWNNLFSLFEMSKYFLSVVPWINKLILFTIQWKAKCKNLKMRFDQIHKKFCHYYLNNKIVFISLIYCANFCYKKITLSSKIFHFIYWG